MSEVIWLNKNYNCLLQALKVNMDASDDSFKQESGTIAVRPKEPVIWIVRNRYSCLFYILNVPIVDNWQCNISCC